MHNNIKPTVKAKINFHYGFVGSNLNPKIVVIPDLFKFYLSTLNYN